MNESKWTVYPLAERVRRELHALATEMRDSFSTMMNHLFTTPYLPIKNIAFKMKYIKAFEYRLPDFNRVYYVIIRELHLVVIYFSGTHPDEPSAPTNHELRLMQEIIDEVTKLRQEENQSNDRTTKPIHHKHKRQK